MSHPNSYRSALKLVLSTGIVLVWLINGLFCKLLNLVPRHQQIVARITGHEYAGILTKVIGVAELLMCVWIISGIRSRLCAVVQIIIVAAMNIIEFFAAPDLLLFGHRNILMAGLLIVSIYINEFVLRKDNAKRTGRVRSY